MLDFIKEVGSNIKEASKTIKSKDLEKHSSKMVSGWEISKMDNQMVMESGKLTMEKDLRAFGKMVVTVNLLEKFQKY